MNLAARFVKSLLHRGPLYTMRAIQRQLTVRLSCAIDGFYDRSSGLSTAEYLEVAEMKDVNSENLPRAIRYEPTRARPLRRLLRGLDVSAGTTFVDIGCGKGRVLALAAEAGITRLVGVDFSPGLCEVAQNNLARFRRQTGLEFEYQIVTSDAARYEFESDQNIVFLYNPFDATVLTQVIDRLERSLLAAPREALLIYHNPVWREVIDSRLTFETVREPNFGGCEFVIYRYRPVSVPSSTQQSQTHSPVEKSQ